MLTIRRYAPLLLLLVGLSVLSACGNDGREQIEAELASLRLRLDELNELRGDVSRLEKELVDLKRSFRKLSSPEKAITGVRYRVHSSLMDDPFLGPVDSPLLFMEFSDYQCRPCRSYYNLSRSKIVERFVNGGNMKYVFRDNPLGTHSHAIEAASFAHCAGEQGHYWEAHDLLFSSIEKVENGDFLELIKEMRGTDPKKLSKCLASGRYYREIAEDSADARRLGAKGAPGFFIGLRVGKDVFDGVFVRGAQPYSVFREQIDALYGSMRSRKPKG